MLWSIAHGSGFGSPGVTIKVTAWAGWVPKQKLQGDGCDGAANQNAWNNGSATQLANTGAKLALYQCQLTQQLKGE